MRPRATKKPKDPKRVKAGKKSNRKGKVGEREGRDQLRRLFGCEARRGQQYEGSSDSPDVVTDIPGVHFEVKRAEQLCLYNAVEQATADADGKMPVVLHRRNGKPWLAIVLLDDLPNLSTQLYLTLAANN